MDLAMLGCSSTVIFPASEAEVMKDPKILNWVLLDCFAEGWLPEGTKLSNRQRLVKLCRVPCSQWGTCCWDQQT